MDKTTQKFSNIDEYIEMFPEDVRGKLNKLRDVIKDTAPEAEETISYQMPTFKLNGKYLVYFAAYKNHIGFYPFPSGVKEFKKMSSDFVSSKGTIQFPYDRPIPFDIVKRVVKYRLKEI